MNFQYFVPRHTLQIEGLGEVVSWEGVACTLRSVFGTVHLRVEIVNPPLLFGVRRIKCHVQLESLLTVLF